MEDITFRSKYLSFSFSDWMKFGDALQHAFEGAFYYALFLEGRYDKEKPKLPLTAHICDLADAAGHLPSEVVMVSNASHIPELRKDQFGHWSVAPPPCPYVSISPNEKIFGSTESELLHIGMGGISVACRRSVKTDFSFARRFYNLYRRFATLRDQICLTYPDGEVLSASTAGFNIWLGHEAIRWAREDRRRLLACDGRQGLRPNDDGVTKLPPGRRA